MYISGEQIQEMADIYLGQEEDFKYNPRIWKQKNKLVYINTINKPFSNPRIIFCYSHLIKLLSDKIKYFINPFILITHNSDQNIDSNEIVNSIISNDKLIKWYAQNTTVNNEKLHPIPIGIANMQWPHGRDFMNFVSSNPKIVKTKLVYFNFSISTNSSKRNECYNALSTKNGLGPWLNTVSPFENCKRLAEYQFCICPEGNGYDTHRLWECLYLNCIPIVKNSPFIQILMKYFNFPIVILNNWNDLKLEELNYDKLFFEMDLQSLIPKFN